MWLDALILLPLLMWAVGELVCRGRWLPLALLMAADIVVCWYTAYMSVIFCTLLALLERACATERVAVWRLALRFARPMVAALLLSAWTFVPTVKAMLGSGGAEETGFLGILANIASAGSPMGLARALFTTQPLYLLRGSCLLSMISSTPSRSFTAGSCSSAASSRSSRPSGSAARPSAPRRWSSPACSPQSS